MSTITKGFTKEQLIARINQVTAINKYRISRDPSADGLAMDNELLAIALASLEAEAVAYIRDGFRADGVHFCGGIITAEEHERTKPALSDRYTWKHQPLYTAPPAQVSVPTFEEWCELTKRNPVGWVRDAMLQGAEPPAYEIKRFGEFGANGLTRDDGELSISIQLFHFERGTTAQPVRGGGIVEKYALQAIINALQQQCDRLSDAPIPVIWPAAPQQEA